MILITGAHGFVGQKLFAALPDAVAAPSLRDASAPPDSPKPKPIWAWVSLCPFRLDLFFFSSFLCNFTRIS